MGTYGNGGNQNENQINILLGKFAELFQPIDQNREISFHLHG